VALLDSLLENPDTSMAAVYREPEPEPEDTAVVVRGLTPEQKKAQLDSLAAVRAQQLREGKAPYRRQKLEQPGSFTNVPDTLVTSRPAPQPAQPDSTRVEPPPAADSARAAPTAPPDTSNVIRVVPGR
jgi:hypothetical protein